MDIQKTEIILLLDRSGSMRSIKSEMEKAISDFIDDQKFIPTQSLSQHECLVSLIQFDGAHGVLSNNDCYENVFIEKNIHDIKSITIIPRGNTALLDSLGRAIIETKDRIEKNNSKKVIFVTITDGYENASKTFTKNKIAEMISIQEEKYFWNFYYLGANQDAIKVAADLGVKSKNSVSYATNKFGMEAMRKTISSDIVRNRMGKTREVDEFGKEIDLQSIYVQNLNKTKK